MNSIHEEDREQDFLRMARDRRVKHSEPSKTPSANAYSAKSLPSGMHLESRIDDQEVTIKE